MLTLLGWTALTAGIGVAYGNFHVVGLPLVILGWALVCTVVLRGGADPDRPDWVDTVVAPRLPFGLGDRVHRLPASVAPYVLPAGLIGAASVVWAPVWYARGPWLVVSHWLSRAAALTAVASLWPRWRSRPGAVGASWLAGGLAAAAGVTMIWAAPVPDIDVWFLLQEAGRGLTRGDNVYTQTWPGSPGLTDTYPYLPLTSVLLLPGQLLFGDVRYGLVAASLLTAYVLHRLAGPRALAMLPLLILLYPRVTFSWAQSWTEPLLLAALAGMVLAVRASRGVVAVIAFALALATKQHVVLLIPLAACWPAFGWRRTAAAGGLAGLLVLPWFLANPAAMIEDAVSANLGLGVITRALNIPSLLLHGGIRLGFVPVVLALTAAYVLVLRRLPRDSYGFALGSAFVLYTLDLMNTQSFFNHYTLPAGLLLVAVAVRTADRVGGESRPAAHARPGRSLSGATDAAFSAGPTGPGESARSSSATAGHRFTRARNGPD